MRVAAHVHLIDHDSPGAPPLVVLVAADVERTTDGKRFGPARAVGAAYGPDAKPAFGEGSMRLRDVAQDLVDKESNAWRLWDALAEEFDKKMEAA